MNSKILLLTCLSGSLLANPDGGVVVSGSADISSVDSTVNIDQSSTQAWIDWDSFSIAADEQVNFNLTDNNGLTVNRVIGNDLSEILGQLNSNGSVYLINPNGILFGDTARIDVGSLLATDHWLSQDGTLTTSQNSAGIKNLGTINSREDLTLLATELHNSGTLSANNINLLSNGGALLALDDSGVISVLVPADSDDQSWVDNTGALIANNQLYLGSAHKNDWLNQLAEDNQVSVSGSLNGQSIDIQGSDINLDGAELTAQLINIESQQTTYIGNSQLSAVDEKVRIRGDEIQVYNGTDINVGSGQLTIGGLFQGGLSESEDEGDDHNADFVHVSSTVNLYGNAGTHGNGGEIILWSDGTTSFHGTIETQGGTYSGDGGFVEVSGKETLVFRGDVNTLAANGNTGTLLLDPTVITIADGAGADVGNINTVEIVSDADGDNAGVATIYEATLEGISAGTDIQLVATERIEFADLTDNELTLDQGLSLTVNAGSFGSIQMLGADDTIRFTDEDLFQVVVNGNGNGVTSYVDLNDVVFDAGGDFTINVQHSGDVTSGATIDFGNITNFGIATEDTLNFLVNNSSAATAININGDINWDGDDNANHYVQLTTQTGGATAGTINNYGDINSFGGDIILSSGTMELLDPDLTNTISALNVNAAGGDVDLTAFTALAANTISGNTALTNGQSLLIGTTNDLNLDWDEFTNIYFLTYKTTGDVDLGTAGTGATNITNTELGFIDSSATRLTVQTIDSIITNSAVIDTQLALRADREGNGTGTISLNGLDTTNKNLTLTGADVTLVGNSVVVGTGNITIRSAGESISVNGSETFNIETGLWDELNNNTGTITIEGLSGGNTIWWEEATLGGDVILDGSGGAGIVFQNGPFTFGGTNTLQLIGDAYITENLSMTDASSSLDIDGDLYVGSVSGGGGDTVSISANWDTTGLTSVDLIGDTGDFAVLSHTPDSLFSLPAVVSANGVDLNLESNGGVTTSGISAGNLDVEWDLNSDGTDTLTTTGVYAVADLNLFGHGSNDDVSLDGTWTISGNVTTATIDTFNVVNDALTANSFDFTGANTIAFGAGSTHNMTSTGGNISLPNMTSDRRVNFFSDGDINFSAITTTNDRVDFQAVDITGDGSAINLGSADIRFQTKTGDATMSIGDGGADPYTVESNIWDNLTVGGIILDGFGNNDDITFLEDTLPANLTGPGGTNAQLTFSGTGQNFVGATVTTSADVTFLQDFTSDSLLNINGAVTVGEPGGADIAISAVWDTSGITSIELAGDAGDTFTLEKTNASEFNIPLVTSANDSNLIINSIEGIDMIGADIGNLTINIDTDSDGADRFVTSGAFDINDLFVQGTLGAGSVRNDYVEIDGTWTINGEVRFNTLSDVTFLNDAFVANGLLQMQTGTTVTLGSSGTAFNMASTTAYVQFDTLTGNRPLNISAPGSLFIDSVNVASRELNLTSDSDLAGDEAVDIGFIQAGDLTIAGDMVWDFNPVLSGDYIQSRGDVIFSDAAVSGFGIDLTSADSVTLSGTSNTLEARSGDVIVTGATDDGSNANLIIEATGAITATNIDTGTGDLTLEADTNTSGGEVATLTGGTGGILTLNSNSTLSGTLDYTSLVTTSAVTLNDALLTVASLDNSAWASTTLAGTSNTITADAGNVILDSVTGTTTDLIVNATGSITGRNINTGTGDLTLNSDSDTAGLETVALSDSIGAMLTLSDAATLSGAVDYSSLVTTSAITLNDAALVFDSFDNTGWASTLLNGSSNSIRVNDGGNLTLINTATGTNSSLALLLGSGTHQMTNIDQGTGNISVTGITATTNQDLTASGTWAYTDLTVTGLNSFTNNAALAGVGDTSISVDGDIGFASGATVDSDTVALDAGNDVAITGVTARSETAPSVTITAGGNLLDAGNTNDDIDAYTPDHVVLDITGTTDPLDYSYTIVVDIVDVINIIDEVLGTEPESVIEDASESDDPVESVTASVGALPKNRVDMYMPECGNDNKNCKKKNAVRKFLSALLIGGALPQ